MKSKVFVQTIALCMVLCLVSFMSFTSISCTGDDDDNDTVPTATPTQKPDKPTPTPTVEPPPGMGTLNIWTTPVSGDIYINGEYIGNGVWTGDVEPGDYYISFGYVPDYSMPYERTVTVVEDETTHVEGLYTPLLCYFHNIMYSVNDSGEWTYYNDAPGGWIPVIQGDILYIRFEFHSGVSWTASTYRNLNPIYPASGSGTGTFIITFEVLSFDMSDYLYLDGIGIQTDDTCSETISISIMD